MNAPQRPDHEHYQNVITPYHGQPFLVLPLNGDGGFEAWNSSLKRQLGARNLLHHLFLDERRFPLLSQEELDCAVCRGNWDNGKDTVRCWILLSAFGSPQIWRALEAHGWRRYDPSPKYHYDMILAVCGPRVPGWH